MKLVRYLYSADGIFSHLLDDKDRIIAVTLEHAYASDGVEGAWLPKIPLGEYKCVRGLHRLSGMTSQFQTFEITGVAGHSNLLFHWGNWNKDSEGCVLLGKMKVDSMVTNSRETFGDFMKNLDGVDEFQLTVADAT